MSRMPVGVALLLFLPSGLQATAQLGGEWREAPAFLPLFAPPGARAEAYRAYVAPLDLATILARLTDDPSLLRPPGAWEPQALLPLDAFGQTGSYSRWSLVRLYGPRRAMVARGPRVVDGRVAESWTLVSPYPDATLQRLEPRHPADRAEAG